MIPINDQMIALYGKGNDNFRCKDCQYYQSKKCMESDPYKPKLVSAYGLTCGKFGKVEG